MLRIDPSFQPYVESLLEHAATALWPERRAALESFARGIAACPEDQLAAAAERLPGDWPAEIEPAELLFRAVLAVYLEQLGDHRITNPDQAVLYALSLEPEHIALADAWLEDHPEYAAPVEDAKV